MFFARHPDTTLFFESNLRAGGLVDRGEPQQATYAAALGAGGEILGLAAHTWTGNVLVEAPAGLAAAVRTAVAGAATRPIAGILGRYAQVGAARAALGLDGAATEMDSREDLFGLELAALHVPAPLASGALRCRPAEPGDLERLVAWRHDYRVETLREPPGAALRAASREEMALYVRLGRSFVLEAGGDPVGYAAYNAVTPACVQIGGVWTPPGLRVRGFARAVVAGALLAARERGVRRSVLFTQPDNHPARAVYRALGYALRGDYGMLRFAAPQRVVG